MSFLKFNKNFTVLFLEVSVIILSSYFIFLIFVKQILLIPVLLLIMFVIYLFKGFRKYFMRYFIWPLILLGVFSTFFFGDIEIAIGEKFISGFIVKQSYVESEDGKVLNVLPIYPSKKLKDIFFWGKRIWCLLIALFFYIIIMYYKKVC